MDIALSQKIISLAETGQRVLMELFEAGELPSQAIGIEIMGKAKTICDHDEKKEQASHLCFIDYER